MYMCIYRHAVILISNFRRVLNVVCVLLGDSPGNHPKESIQHAVMFTHTHTHSYRGQYDWYRWRVRSFGMWHGAFRHCGPL